jgi:hypothetical protein
MSFILFVWDFGFHLSVWIHRFTQVVNIRSNVCIASEMFSSAANYADVPEMLLMLL